MAILWLVSISPSFILSGMHARLAKLGKNISFSYRLAFSFRMANCRDCRSLAGNLMPRCLPTASLLSKARCHRPLLLVRQSLLHLESSLVNRSACWSFSTNVARDHLALLLRNQAIRNMAIELDRGVLSDTVFWADA